jgi:hypothetical protein
MVLNTISYSYSCDSFAPDRSDNITNLINFIKLCPIAPIQMELPPLVKTRWMVRLHTRNPLGAFPIIKKKEQISLYFFIMCRCPLYYHLKFAFLVWLQLPSADVSLSLWFFLSIWQVLGGKRCILLLTTIFVPLDCHVY